MHSRAFNLPWFKLLLFETGLDQGFLAVSIGLISLIITVLIAAMTMPAGTEPAVFTAAIVIYFVVAYVVGESDKISIKKAHQLKLPALRQIFLELQALKLDPYVKLVSEDFQSRIYISLWVCYTKEFEDLFKGI